LSSTAFTALDPMSSPINVLLRRKNTGVSPFPRSVLEKGKAGTSLAVSRKATNLAEEDRFVYSGAESAKHSHYRIVGR
jgi:hypothetical protein